MAKIKLLGQLLIEKSLVTEDQIDEALRIQVGGNRRIGYILTQMGVLSNDQMLEVLSEQLDQPIIDIDNMFSEEVKSVLPRYLCRKYTVIPLSIKDNNVLNLAMIDPSDDEAISDIEKYTKKVVKTALAHGESINIAIGKKIPYTFNDLLHSPVSLIAKSAGVIAVLILCLTGYFTYQYVMTETYGTVTISGPVTTYKNHDLMLGVEGPTISLMGHAAYAQGFYKVTFNNAKDLKSFLQHKKKKFSEKQYQWLMRVANDSLPPTPVDKP